MPCTGAVLYVVTFVTSGSESTPEASPPGSLADLKLPPLPPKGGLAWKAGDYEIKLGGYVKVDVIHDFNQIGSQDSFDPRTIPAKHDPSLPDENTRVHARQSRLNLDVDGPIHLFFEGDFFGSGNSFRMRHAYGEIGVLDGRLLGGQTWTTFMDDAAMPETIDFESAIAFPQVRQAQIRWRRELGNDAHFAVAIEDPDSDVLEPAGVTGSAKELLPDLTARVRWGNERGHVQVGLFGGLVGFDGPTTDDETEPLWGVNVSTKVKTVGRDFAIVLLTYGDGVGRYRGGNVAAIDSGGGLEAISIVAITGSYQHHWSEQLRSNVTYAWAGADAPSSVPQSTAQRVDYLAVNLIWQFHERAWTGIEYLHGSIDTVGHDYGGDHRVQLAIRFDL